MGETRLAKALADQPDPEVEVRWRPFQLQPGMPERGLPWDEFARQKFGGQDGAKAAFAHVTAAGEPDGIRFDFDRVASAPNTVDAHRLILLAENYGLQWEVAGALFRGYFTEGRDLNNREDLVDLASCAGLDVAEVRQYLAGEGGAYEVYSSQDEARRLGITGVPFYVFDGRYALYGARPVAVFKEALDTVRTEGASRGIG